MIGITIHQPLCEPMFIGFDTEDAVGIDNMDSVVLASLNMQLHVLDK